MLKRGYYWWEVPEMSTRRPCALNFYARECKKEQIEEYIKGFKISSDPAKIVAGIVPHAGWMFSGAVAAKVFNSIKAKNKPAAFILLGAIHQWGKEKNSVYSSGAWSTPLGNVEVDSDIASSLLESAKNLLVENSQAHFQEHSLEVQVPFIKYFFPQAKIVPIQIVPDENAALTGKKIGEVVAQSKKEIVVIGSTDLTHYGDNYGFVPQGYGSRALKWLKENDARIIKLCLEMKAEDIVEEAMVDKNACGAGAMAATVAAAKALGAKKGVLVEHTTSYDVLPEGDFDMGVGYVGIVF
jgi:AmmeMemoRadiSam system protein B